jgi:hypothetical protein
MPQAMQLVVIFLSSTTIAAAPRIPVAPDDARAIELYDQSEFQPHVARWAEAPAYQKVVLGERLVGMLGSRILCPSPRDYVPVAGEHDLRVLGGRAAFSLDQMFGTRLAPVTRASSDDDLKGVTIQAQTAIRAYRQALLDFSRHQATPTVADLNTKYGERIRGRPQNGVIRTDVPQRLTAMQELLDEWLPLGKPIDDLAAIIGASGEVIGGDRIYTFDSGLGGCEFRFVVTNGSIVNVVISSLE